MAMFDQQTNKPILIACVRGFGTEWWPEVHDPATGIGIYREEHERGPFTSFKQAQFAADMIVSRLPAGSSVLCK
jgi:hypothetical protein